MENIEAGRVKGIIFDYGGTIDSKGDHWSHVIYQAYLDAGFNIDYEKFREAYVHGERTLGRERIILPMDNFLALMEKKIRIEMIRLIELGELHPDVLSNGSVARVACLCYGAARRCIDEARPSVERLAEHYPLVLVSNFYGNVEEVLRDFGLRNLFKGVIESAVVGIRKPNPTIFRLGTVALELPPEEVLVVGDSLTKDILPAESIGCEVAWIKGRGWTPDEDAREHPSRIPSLEALADKLCK